MHIVFNRVSRICSMITYPKKKICTTFSIATEETINVNQLVRFTL